MNQLFYHIFCVQHLDFTLKTPNNPINKAFLEVLSVIAWDVQLFYIQKEKHLKKEGFLKNPSPIAIITRR